MNVMQLYFSKTEDLRNNRWDANYWRRDLLVSIEQLDSFKVPVFPLSEIAYVSIGQSGKRTFTEVENEAVQYLVIGNLLAAGIDFKKRPRYVEAEGFNDPKRSRVENEDILLAISGGGSIGRTTLALGIEKPTNISQDIALVRFKDFPVYASFLFLQSKWGVSQILRFENGTGVTHLNQDEVKNIRIPQFPEILEEWAKTKWLSFYQLHNAYLNAQTKESKEEAEKKRLLLIAEFEKKATTYIRK